MALRLSKQFRLPTCTGRAHEMMTTDNGNSSDLQFNSGYISYYFVKNAEKRIAELDHPYILIHDKRLSGLQEILPLLEIIIRSDRPLLIIAEDVVGEALATLVLNKQRGSIKVVAVRTPTVDGNREEMLEDIATLTGAVVVNDVLGINLENITCDMLGTADRVFIDRNTTTILGGGGKEIQPADALSTRVNTSAAHGTIAQEIKLQNWLTAEMAAAPEEPRSKATMKAEAEAAKLKFTGRGFARSWSFAVVASGAAAWSTPGPRSSRRIETRD
jgi:chaperonin GroEL (HSP60 family)